MQAPKRAWLPIRRWLRCQRRRRSNDKAIPVIERMAAPHAVTKARVSPHQPPASPVCAKRTQLRHCCPRLKAANGSRRSTCRVFGSIKTCSRSSGWPPSPRSTMKLNPGGPGVRRRVALRQPFTLLVAWVKAWSRCAGRSCFATSRRRGAPFPPRTGSGLRARRKSSALADG